jgi:type II secretory ATPase GspE/PulE/Tfp pilus assembly ATPase PilB-like protein
MTELVKEGSLGSILLKSKIIGEGDIAAALAEQQASGCRIGEALVKLGVVTQEDIDWALANQLNIPFVRLKRELVDPAVCALVPAVTARRYGLLPLIRSGDELSIAMADPLNREAVEAVESLTGCRVTVSIALLRELQEMQEHVYGPPATTETLRFGSQLFPPTALARMNADLSGTTLLDYLLLYLVQNRLAAISLQPVRDQVVVTARKAGQLRELGRLPTDRAEPVMQRIRRLGDINGSTERSATGMISFRHRGREIVFQVLLLRGVGGDYVTIRQQLLSPFPSTVDRFGGNPEKQEEFQHLALLKRGLILCAARNGEERARLMDLFLETTETAGRNVVLVGEGLGRGSKEFPRIPCQEVPAAEFGGLLGAVLDHDPDVIALENATDGQVFTAAGKAAMRGKLVLAGLDFTNLAALFKHLRYFWRRHCFVPTYLRGIIVARGVLTLCPLCRENYTPSAEELNAMALTSPPARFYRTTGCAACEQTGYLERKYLLDVIPFTAELVEVFENAGDAREVLAHLERTGYRTSQAEGEEMLRNGEISPAEYVASLLL